MCICKVVWKIQNRADLKWGGGLAAGFVWCLLSPHPAALILKGLVIADSGCESTSPYN